jgi:hypothetical protein
VTGASAVTEPNLLRAVSLYVVVAVGLTLRVPDALTVPMPSISTVSAFSTFQVSVDD